MERISKQEMLDLSGTYWESLKQEFFKLETKQVYKEDEGESYDLYLRGDVESAIRVLEKSIATQKSLYEFARLNSISLVRLHIVELPLTDYMRYEIESYRISKRYGEQIYLVCRKDVHDLEKTVRIRDYLLFDEEKVILQFHNQFGEFEYAEVSEITSEVKPYVLSKTALLNRAKPLNDFLASRKKE